MEERFWAKVNTAMGRYGEFEIPEFSSEFPRLESREVMEAHQFTQKQGGTQEYDHHLKSVLDVSGVWLRPVISPFLSK